VLKLVLAVDLDVGHHHSQHLLVYVNSRNPVWHRPLLLGAESVPCRITQGRGLSPVPIEALNDAQLFAQSRTLRVKQLLGLDGSTGSIRSRRSRRCDSDLHAIFIAFRGLKAQA
jgi:hypothetical protein